MTTGIALLALVLASLSLLYVWKKRGSFKESDKSGSDKFWDIFSAIILVIILLVWGFYELTAANFSGFPKSASELGDAFGLIEAIFSGLAFAGIITALYLQREDLELQRKELALTREELKGQKEQLAEQVKALEKQNLERSYFQIISTHIDIASKVSFKKQEGKVAIDSIYNELKSLIKSKHTGENRNEAILEGYREFESDLAKHVGHIVQSYKFIISFLSKMTEDGYVAKEYIEIFLSQLPNSEKAIFYYMCFYSYRKELFYREWAFDAIIEQAPKEILYQNAEVFEL